MQQIRMWRQNKKTLKLERLFICDNDLVQQVGESFHQIRDEVARWRNILEVPYQEHLRSHPQ